MGGTPRPPSRRCKAKGGCRPLKRSPPGGRRLGGTPCPPSQRAAPMGAAAPLRYYSGSDDGLGGTARPPCRRGGVNRGCRPPQAISRQRRPPSGDTPSTLPVAPHPWGLSSPTCTLRSSTHTHQAATTDWAGHPPPPPGRWDRAYGGCRPLQPLYKQPPPPGQDTLSP